MSVIELPTGKRGFWLLDVDGPLNPYGGTNKPRERAGYRPYKIPAYDGFLGDNVFKVWLHPEHGPKISEVAEEARLEPVWCTTWEHQANSKIAPKIGLSGALPVIEFSTTIRTPLWKIPGILNDVPQDVPLIWSDDDFRLHPDAVDYLLENRRSGLTVLHTVSPKVGFTAEDFEYVREWGTQLREPDEEQARTTPGRA